MGAPFLWIARLIKIMSTGKERDSNEKDGPHFLTRPLMVIVPAKVSVRIKQSHHQVPVITALTATGELT